MINNQISQFIPLSMIIAYYFYTSIIGVMIKIYLDSDQHMEFA